MAFGIGSVTAKIDADITGFKKGISDAESGVDSLKGKLGKLQDDLGNFGKKMSLFVTAPIVAAGTYALKTAADFEQLQVALTTILGDESKALTLLAELEEFAKSTPFQFTDLAAGTKQLLAYGFAQDEIIDTTRILGDVSAGLNIPIGDSIYLYGTLRAQQVAYTKDLNQFANRGIPIWDELSKIMGKSVPEIRKLVEAGEVGFPVVEQAFINMTSEGGKFHNLMQAQSETTAGQFSNLQDSIGFLARDIGTLLLPYAIELVKKLRELVDWFNGLTEEQKKTIIVVLGVVAAIGPLLIILSTLVSGVTAVITIVQGMGVALAFLAANPIVLLIGAIILLAALIVSNWDQIKAAFELGKIFITNIMNGIVDVLKKVGGFIFDVITAPFRNAWETIKGIVNSIKDALDFTKRNSPSVVDIVNRGVGLVNKALDGLTYGLNMDTNLAAASVSSNSTGPNITNVRIDMGGAVISDEFGAERMGELIGNSIIRKLQNNVRF